jgi:hypothetical protein
MQRESTLFFVVDGPALDVRGNLVALGSPAGELSSFVAARAPDQKRAVLTLFFERCDGRALSHRVVELTGDAGAPIVRVLADGPGIGLGLYDLDGNLFVQGGERLTLYPLEAEPRVLAPGLQLLSSLPPLSCPTPQ